MGYLSNLMTLTTTEIHNSTKSLLRNISEGSVQEKGAMDWKGSLRRVIYPTGETIKNAENYKEAAARYEFGDNTKSRMWWDARKTIKE